MTIIAAFTALTGLILKCIVAGWLTAIFIWFYVAIGVIHIMIHRQASHAIPQNRALALVSNILLLMAFLAQLDEGNGPCKWFTIAALLYGEDFSPCFYQISPVLNFIVFAPPAVTWVFLVSKTRARRAVGVALIVLPFFVAWLGILVFGPEALFVVLWWGFVPILLVAVVWMAIWIVKGIKFLIPILLAAVAWMAIWIVKGVKSLTQR